MRTCSAQALFEVEKATYEGTQVQTPEPGGVSQSSSKLFGGGLKCESFTGECNPLDEKSGKTEGCDS